LSLLTPQSLRVDALDKHEMYALRALAEGNADAHQQVLALSVVLKKFCRTYDLAFVPGKADESAFLAGRQFPGQQIMKYLKLNPTLIEEMKNG
jgi:hypothetical protein